MCNLKLATYIFVNCVVTAIIFIGCVGLALFIAWLAIATGVVDRESVGQNGLGFIWIVFVFIPCAFAGAMGAIEYFIHMFGHEKDSETFEKFKRSIGM